ncbi:MAG TPA: SDR family oxidoreductase [Anaerolineae bacterium]|nr:SDR family oxidoreductase [Anaerolineae bacterium]HIP72203.1 SDR family oxidoreductase [Anaerolineae bacterium]
MKILITGGSSYLGRRLVPLALLEHDIVYTWFQHDPLGLAQGRRLDVRDDTAVTQLVRTFQPQVIIHLAGSNRGRDMENVIRRGTQNITVAARAVNTRLIHLSTDSIFRGDAAPYDETAVPTPVNPYGQAKADAETIVQNWPNHIIIRTSLIYSLEEMDHGTAWMAAALQAGQPVTLFNNQIRNPVWASSLAQACLELAASDFTGILNVAGRQVLSRADFALKMLDWWGINQRDTLHIGPSTGNQWPLNCELDLSLATAVLQTPLPGVDEVINVQ